ERIPEASVLEAVLGLISRVYAKEQVIVLQRCVDVSCDSIQTKASCCVSDLAAESGVGLLGDCIDQAAVGDKASAEQRAAWSFDDLYSFDVRRVEAPAGKTGQTVDHGSLCFEAPKRIIRRTVTIGPTRRFPELMDPGNVLECVVKVGDGLFLQQVG